MNTTSHTRRDIAHTTLAVFFIGILIASSSWVLRPFLISIAWAFLIVVATWPVLLKLQTQLWGRRGLAVAIMTAALLLIVFIPLTLAVLTIINNAEDITARIKSLAALTVSPPPDWVKRIPLAGVRLSARWQEFASLTSEERSVMAAPYARKALEWFLVQAGSIGIMMLNFLLTVIIAAIMYAKGELAAAGILSFARRLAGEHGEKVAVLAAKAIRGVALGIVLTSLIQATLGGIGLAVTGVPAAALLTAVMFMLCLAQIGPALVLVPAVIWLYMKDGALWGTVLLVLSILAGTVDNIIRPLFIKKGANLPLIMVFAGVIGGLVAFGIVGIFIGPVVLAVTYTLLKAWVSAGEPTVDVETSDGE
jgi:predicted PurR-regulated permease PerM